MHSSKMMVKVSRKPNNQIPVINYINTNLFHTLTDDDESGELFREEETKPSKEDDGDKTKKIE